MYVQRNDCENVLHTSHPHTHSHTQGRESELDVSAGPGEGCPVQHLCLYQTLGQPF